jgi:hypothetical protein
MQTITSSFINVALGLTVIFALVLVFYYFKLRRDLSLTDVDKNLWHFKLSTLFLVALFFVAALYLPPTGFYSDIEVSALRETVLQELIQNQKRTGNQLHDLREILYILFIMLAVYFSSAATLIGGIQRERRRLASINNPATEKPLGLDTD